MLPHDRPGVWAVDGKINSALAISSVATYGNQILNAILGVMSINIRDRNRVVNRVNVAMCIN
jgi:hypothetical protein